MAQLHREDARYDVFGPADDVPASGASGPGHAIACALVVGVAYALGSFVGRSLFFPGSTYSVIWPPTAILTLALLVLARRDWVPALAGAALAHLATQWGRPPLILAFTLSHNVGLAVLAATLSDRFIGRPIRLNGLRPTVRFLALVVLAAPAAISFSDLVMRGVRDLPQTAVEVYFLSFFSNAVAMVLIIPPALVLAKFWRSGRRWPDGRRALELAVLLCGLAIASLLASAGPDVRPPGFLALPLPFLLWAAVRFGPGGVSAAVATLFVVFVTQTLAGGGPVPRDSVLASLFSLQAFALNIALTLLLLSALVAERAATADRARRAEDLLHRSLETSGTAAWHVDMETGSTIVWNSLVRPSERGRTAPTTLAKAIASLHPADRAAVEASLFGEGATAELNLEVRARTPDGRRRWLLMRGRRSEAAPGRPVAFTGTTVDITARRRLERALRRSRSRTRAMARDVLDGRESERRALGARIHEEIAQQVAAIGLDVGLVRARADGTDPRVAEVLDRLQSSIDRLVLELRELSRDLRSASLEYVGLGAAIETLAGATERRAGIPVAAHVATLSIDAERASEVYQVARELLGHAADRPDARSLSIELNADETWIEMEVRAFGTTATAAAPDTLYEQIALLCGELRTGFTQAGTWRARARMRLECDRNGVGATG